LLKILAIKTSIDYQAKEVIDTAEEAAGAAEHLKQGNLCSKNDDVLKLKWMSRGWTQSFNHF